MAHVLKTARIQRAAMSVFVLKAFFQLVSRMGQSVLPRVGTLSSKKKNLHKCFLFFLSKPNSELKLLIEFNFCTGNPPVLLLPDNIRIRRFNLSTEEYSDYVDNTEHIQALDYLWDPEGQGLSMLL